MAPPPPEAFAATLTPDASPVLSGDRISSPRPSWGRRALALVGPAWLVAVGYVDPGNWATDLAGGSGYGYDLLWVVAGAGLAAMVLQVLAARLGVATGRDLAQLTAETMPAWTRVPMWLFAEAAICACDLAELIGAAIALALLLQVPLLIGVALSGLGALVVLAPRRGAGLQQGIALVLAFVAACFVAELAMARPDWRAAAGGLAPSLGSLARPGALYLAVAIVGATVMPHNLYLHSALAAREGGRKRALTRFLDADSCAALAFALLLNGAILILAASVFHHPGAAPVAELQDAYRLLIPLLGPFAAAIFALGLLASGQSASVTATLAGQVVMEGFVRWRISPALRRLATRLVALVPAVLVVTWWGDAGLSRLLIGSQALLSLQLPLAMIPLMIFVGGRRRMAACPPPAWLVAAGWAVAAGVLALNAALLVLPGS